MNTYDAQYIGALASIKDLDSNTYRDSVFVNAQNYIQFLVKSKSVPMIPQQLFTGYISSFVDDDVNDDGYYTEDERIDNFYNQVKDKLFIFSYKFKDGKYYNITKAQLVVRPMGLEENTLFVSVPVFSSMNNAEVKNWEYQKNFRLYRDFTNYSEFVERISGLKSLGSIYGYDSSILRPFVVWYDENDEYYAVGQINDYRESSMGGVILESNQLQKINLSEFENFFVYDEQVNPTLMFIPQEIYEKISNIILQASTTRVESTENEENENSQDDIIDSEVSVEDNDVTPVPELKTIDISEHNDELILECMRYHSQMQHLFYKIDDLVNFHTAVKCNSMVILSGLSGTGKSALVDVYAKALGINTKDDNRLLFVSVRPSWNDDSDLLGYVDLVHMVYRPSDTGFINLLVEASREENKDKMFLVCFDEMNLARVEHYFSQFLSILERPSNQRILRLYDAQYTGRLYNSSDYPATIMIGNNIRFIGTVNIDESTYHFSDKVLDRTNVITLEVLNYSKDWVEEKYAAFTSSVKWTLKDYETITVKGEENGEIREFLWRIHSLLQKNSKKLGIGPRIVKSIELYMSNLPKDGELGLEFGAGLDYQIAQRVLTKVRGPENQIGKLLSENAEDEGLISLFDEYITLSSFKKCREIVKTKRDEVETYGYCV